MGAAPAAVPVAEEPLSLGGKGREARAVRSLFFSNSGAPQQVSTGVEGNISTNTGKVSRVRKRGGAAAAVAAVQGDQINVGPLAQALAASGLSPDKKKTRGEDKV
jgi:hypothetical protein